MIVLTPEAFTSILMAVAAVAVLVGAAVGNYTAHADNERNDHAR